ncbi:hypothetical protein ACX0G7_01895 [Flavitalea antarctica]
MEKTYKNISALFVLILVGILWGFHRSYTVEFPDFKSFQMTHHIHGGLMMSWLFMLIAQPIFIATGRIKTHRMIGKLAYIIGPLITIYLFLIAQLGYHRGAENPEFARAVMVLDLRGLFFFTLLYVLALSYRKTTAYHMRFMIGTGLLMIGPGFGRALISSFGVSLWDAITYTDTAAIVITIALLIYDIVKKNPVAPYTIVLIVLVIEKLLWYYRMSGPWQIFAGKFAELFF